MLCLTQHARLSLAHAHSLSSSTSPVLMRPSLLSPHSRSPSHGLYFGPFGEPSCRTRCRAWCGGAPQRPSTDQNLPPEHRLDGRRAAYLSVEPGTGACQPRDHGGALWRHAVHTSHHASITLPSSQRQPHRCRHCAKTHHCRRVALVRPARMCPCTMAHSHAHSHSRTLSHARERPSVLTGVRRGSELSPTPIHTTSHHTAYADIRPHMCHLFLSFSIPSTFSPSSCPLT